MRGRSLTAAGSGSRKCVDDFACARVVEFFTRLMFNGCGIILQLVHVIVETCILSLQLLHLLLQLAGFFTLVGEYGESVVPENDAIAHDENQGSRTHRCELAA